MSAGQGANQLDVDTDADTKGDAHAPAMGVVELLRRDC
jgi:hypothetical protein